MAITHYRYLTNQSYNPIIQPQYLIQQLCQNNQNNLVQAEKLAIEEVSGILTQRYDLATEFTQTTIWQYGATYTPANRIYLDYATWSSAQSYNLGNCVTYNGEAYILTGTTSLAATASFNTTYYTDLGQQFYDYYYVNYPAPLFNYQTLYTVGQKVFYKGQIWTSVITDLENSQSYVNQFIDINNVPTGIFPDDPVKNANYAYWKPSSVYNMTPIIGQTYSFTQSGTSSVFVGTYSIYDTLPTNTNFWTYGDNRSQLIVSHTMQIALYYLHKTIAPTNIPEMRVKAYKDALAYLYDLAYGKRNSVVLVDQPSKGIIWFGGNSKKSSFY